MYTRIFPGSELAFGGWSWGWVIQARWKVYSEKRFHFLLVEQLKHIWEGFELNLGAAKNFCMQEKTLCVHNHIFGVERWAWLKALGRERRIRQAICIIISELAHLYLCGWCGPDSDYTINIFCSIEAKALFKAYRMYRYTVQYDLC